MTDARIAFSLASSPDHDYEGHVETPGRFRFLPALTALPFSDRMLELQPEPADAADLDRVHSAEHRAWVEAMSESAPLEFEDGDLYFTPGTYRAALDSAGAAVETTRCVLEGRTTCGFSLGRPPGHHATPERAMGFCFFNNAAVAARRAQAEGAGKVLIFDFDVHHGNGTQDIFFDDPSVCYVSTHQGGIYPGTGHLTELGPPGARDTLVNLPLPAGAGDTALAQVVERILRPLAARFAPDLILVSAGFDAHWRDPLAQLLVTCQGYHRVARELLAVARSACGGRIVFLLEGGYDPEAVGGSVEAVFYALADLPAPPDPLGPAPMGEVGVSTILDQAAAIHSL